MILRIKIPDETYEAFGTFNPKNPRSVIEASLEKFQGTDPTRKAIVLSGENLSALQKLLSASVDTPEGLVEAIKGRLTFQVGGVEVELDEAQRKRLVLQAQAWKREPEEFIQAQIRENLRSL